MKKIILLIIVIAFMFLLQKFTGIGLNTQSFIQQGVFEKMYLIK